MVRHNNMIPNQHFHKKWQRRVRINFNQPFKKKMRNLKRTKKINEESPRPLHLLRPLVNCPSFRYNSKKRIGRGFTPMELKKAGLNPSYAMTVGICVDKRRRNNCVENLMKNVERLKEYVQKLIVFPSSGKKKDVNIEESAIQHSVCNIKDVNAHKCFKMRNTSRRIMEVEKKFSAFVTLRQARAQKKKTSRKLKRAKKAIDDGLEEFKK